MRRLKKREKMILGMMVLLLALAAALVISRKVNLHVDEVYTYGLANHPYENTFNMEPEEGKTYEPAEEAWDEYMQVQEGHEFDYKNVWENQKADVHPPLYYTLIHTICSFFPGQYSIWFAGIVNVVFAALTLGAVFFLALELTGKKKTAFLSAGFFGLSAGTLSSAAFMRMYIMTMFWVALITWLMVKYFRRKKGKTFYVLLPLISTAGILTHYYFLIYLFFLCCVWGIFLLLERKFRDVLKFLIAMGVSGGASLLIFPSMVRQILDGNRGVEAVDNLKNTSLSEYADRLSAFYGFVSRQIFGGFLSLILILLAAAVLIRVIRKKMPAFRGKILLLLVPCAGYFFLVSKIAAYSYDRYIQPVYPVTAVLGCCAVCFIWQTFLPSGRRLVPAVSLSLAAAACCGLIRCPWTYLYRESRPLLQTAAERADSRCIYIYDGGWKTQPSFYEVRNYRSVTFITPDRLDQLDDLDLGRDTDLTVCIMDTCDSGPVEEKLGSIYQEPVTLKPLGQYFFTTTYELETEP